jgi:hypothetical protein
MPVHWEAQSEPIAGYRLIERLGRGGFGEVWKAEAPGGLLKAIKFVHGDLLPDSPGPSCLEQELRALNRIRAVRHPYVLSVDRIDQIDGQLVIVMELADRSLDDRMRECRRAGLPGIPRKELLKYLWEAAEALDVMNREFDLQHLDIKPKNLFLVGEHVKVGDFGLVKDLEGVTAEVTGGVTPIYGAPETFDGWVSRFTDQYSLAIVYQELLTGVRPFRGPSIRQLMMQHLGRAPDLEPLPESDRPIVARALAKQPDCRFPACRDFIEALIRAEGAGVSEILSGSAGEPEQLETNERTRIHETTVPRRADELSAHPTAGPTTSGARSAWELGFGAQPEAPPRPTLVVGVGAAGTACLDRLRRRLDESAADDRTRAAIRFLVLDCEPGAGQPNGESRGLAWRFVSCTLDKPARYWSQWSKLTHLSAWLDPNGVMQISRTGGTGGHRRLGRLALFQHYRAVITAVEEELSALGTASPADSALAGARAATPMDRWRVVVVAGMAGGCGAGMFIDLGFLLHSVLAESGAPAAEIHGALLAGVNPAEAHADLRRINHCALVDELDYLMQPGARYCVRYEPNGAEHQFRCAPFDALYIFADGSERNRADATFAGDAAAEWLFQTMTTGLGKRLEELSASLSAFRTFGWFALTYPAEHLLEHVAGRLCRRLIDRWLASRPTQELDEIRTRAETSLAEGGFAAPEIAGHLYEDWTSRLEEPIHEIAARLIVELERRLVVSPADQAENLAQPVLAELKRLLGPDPDEERQSPVQEPLLDRVTRPAPSTVARKLFPALVTALQRAMDEPGSRLDAGKCTWEGFALYLLRMVQRQEDVARTCQQSVSLKMRALRDHLFRVSENRQWSEESIRTLVMLLHEYARRKIDYRLTLQAVHVYLNLHGRLVEKSREISAIRQRLDEWRNPFMASAGATGEPTLLAHEQLVLPGVARTIAECVDEFVASLKSDDFAALDAAVQDSTLANVGGLWSLCATEGRVDSSVTDAVRAQLKRWAQPRLSKLDAAELFFEHLASDPVAQLAKVRVYHEWAAPAAALHLPNHGPAEGDERVLVCAPDSPSGRQFAELVRPLAPDAETVFVTDRSRCVLGRLRAGRSLAGFAPPWIEEMRERYDAACSGPLSPRIIADPRVGQHSP